MVAPLAVKVVALPAQIVALFTVKVILGTTVTLTVFGVVVQVPNAPFTV